jgi:hypothetical protein
MVKKYLSKSKKVNKLWFAFIALLLLQIVTIGYIIKLHTSYSKDSSSLLNRLINESETRRYITPIISVSEDRVYIPEFHIFMPLNDVSRKLQYSISSDLTKDLYLSTTGVVGSQNSDDDPSCDRMVRISTSKNTFTGEKYIGEIAPTKDGLRYIYQNIHKCSIYPPGVSDRLVTTAESIQQY